MTRISIRQYAKENKMPSHEVMRKLKDGGYKPRNITQQFEIATLNNLFNAPIHQTIGEYCNKGDYNLNDVLYFLNCFNKRQFKQKYGVLNEDTLIDQIYLDFYNELMQPDLLPKQYGFTWQQFREAKRAKKAGIMFEDISPKMTYFEIKHMRLAKTTNKKIYNKGNLIQSSMNKKFNRWIIENKHDLNYLIYEQMGYHEKYLPYFDKNKIKEHYKYNKYSKEIKFNIEHKINYKK